MTTARISTLVATCLALSILSPAGATALTAYPGDRAEILAGCGSISKWSSTASSQRVTRG